MRGEALWLWVISVAGFAVMAGALWFAWQSYQNGTAFAAIDPICRQGSAVQMSAEIEVAGDTYRHEVIRRPRISRFVDEDPEDGLARAGNRSCPEAAGIAFVFVLEDRSAVMIRSDLCVEALSRVQEGEPVDALAVCAEEPPLTEAYVVDSLDAPSRWMHFDLTAEDAPLRVTELTAMAGNGRPRDGLDGVADALFNTDFRNGDAVEWPDALVSHGRRYDPDFPGIFVARFEDFAWPPQTQ